jgi:hypothetical protein
VANLTRKITEELPSDSHITKNKPSRGKTIGFAIVVILFLSSLAVAGIGIGGYLQAGSLSQLSQIHAMIMMAAGGCGGIIFLIVGIVGLVKNCSKNSQQQNDSEEKSTQSDSVNVHKNTPTISESDTSDAVTTTNSTPPIDITQDRLISDPSANIQTISTPTNTSEAVTTTNSTPPTDTQKGLIFGPNVWPCLNVKSADANIDPMPNVNWDAEDPFFHKPFRLNYILLYIPRQVLVNGVAEDFTLEIFMKLSCNSFYFGEGIKRSIGKSTAPGWVLISKKAILGSEEVYDTQKQMIEIQKGYHMLRVFEAIALNVVAHKVTGVRLFGPLTYTRCVEKVYKGRCPVVVGNFRDDKLDIYDCEAESSLYGAACARREF